MKIKKAKLCKNGTIETSYIDPDGNEITLKGAHRSHQDLRDAFDRLVPFFTDLTEQKEAERLVWDALDTEETAELLKKIDVTGVSLGGDADNAIITLSGRRVLMTGRVLNLNAPGVEMASETFEWEHVDELDVAVQNLFYEVEQYITAHKWDETQRELDFDGDPEDPFAAAGQPIDGGAFQPADVA